MPEPTPIHVPRDTVNDDSVRVLAWLIEAGKAVTTDQPVMEIETSKAVANVMSPADGLLTHSCKVGDEILIGGVLGYIAAEFPAKVSSAPAEPFSAAVGAAPVMVAVAPVAPSISHTGRRSTASESSPTSTRFSAKAAALAKLRGIDVSLIAQKGLIRERDLERLFAEASSASQPTSQEAVSLPVGVPTREEPLPRTKRIEARYLSAGLHGTLPSAVTVACPTHGLRAAVQEHAELAGQSAPLVIHESARLLRKYPLFNAYHANGSVHFYERVNIGFAMDAGNGLKVPVISDADQKSLSAIAEELREMLVLYLEDKLPVQSLTGGTFTITDLSGEGVMTFSPLINQAQSAILGIGGEHFPSDGGEGFFNLILGFDHQLAEGRLAAQFLNDLKTRLTAYENAMKKQQPAAEEPYCSQCLTPLGQVLAYNRHMLQMLDARGTIVPVCSQCVAGRW